MSADRQLGGCPGGHVYCATLTDMHMLVADAAYIANGEHTAADRDSELGHWVATPATTNVFNFVYNFLVNWKGDKAKAKPMITADDLYRALVRRFRCGQSMVNEHHECMRNVTTRWLWLFRYATGGGTPNIAAATPFTTTKPTS